MFRASVLVLGGRCNLYLPLCEFSHNNSYYSSIDMDSFEALYGRRNRLIITMFDAFEVRTWGTNILND